MAHTLTLALDVYGTQTRTIDVRTVSTLVSLARDYDTQRETARYMLGEYRASISGVVLDEKRVAQALGAAAEATLCDIERKSVVVAEVTADGSGVGCVASVYCAATGRPVPRGAAEGGDHHGGGSYPQQAAALEAEERAQRERCGRLIERRGYTLADVEAMRAAIEAQR